MYSSSSGPNLSVDDLVLARKGIFRLRIPGARFSEGIFLTAVRQAARVPSTDIFDQVGVKEGILCASLPTRNRPLAARYVRRTCNRLGWRCPLLRRSVQATPQTLRVQKQRKLVEGGYRYGKVYVHEANRHLPPLAMGQRSNNV